VLPEKLAVLDIGRQHLSRDTAFPTALTHRHHHSETPSRKVERLTLAASCQEGNMPQVNILMVNGAQRPR